MYKSPKTNFEDFYDQVLEKEKNSKNNGTKIQKAYYEYKDDKT